MRWSEMPEHSNYAVAEWDITDEQKDLIDEGLAFDDDDEYGFSWGIDGKVIYLWIDTNGVVDVSTYAMLFEDYLRSQLGVLIS